MAAVNVTQQVLRSMCYTALNADAGGLLAAWLTALGGAQAAKGLTITDGERLMNTDKKQTAPAIFTGNGSMQDGDRADGLQTINVDVEAWFTLKDVVAANTVTMAWAASLATLKDAIVSTLRTYWLGKNFSPASYSVRVKDSEPVGIATVTVTATWHVPLFRNSATSIQIDTSSGFTDAIVIPTDQKPIVSGIDVVQSVRRVAVITSDPGPPITITFTPTDTKKPTYFVYVDFEMVKAPSTPYSATTTLWGTSTFPMVATPLFPAYDSAHTYNAGDYCQHGNLYYRATGTTTGSFNSGAWVQAFNLTQSTPQLVHKNATPEKWIIREHWSFPTLTWVAV